MRGFMPSNEEQQVVDILRRPWQRSLVFTRGAEWDLSAICRRRWWRTGAGALVMSSQTLSWAPGVSASAMMQDCVPSHAQDFVCLHHFCCSATGRHPQ